jgi:hypothetical protein
MSTERTKMAKKIYKLIQNPKTKGFLRNAEIYCEKCFENFGDEQGLGEVGEEIP